MIAAIAIVGSWLGKIPSGLSLIEQFFLMLVTGGGAGDFGKGPVEYRDEDAVSFYVGVILYFAFACGSLYLIAYFHR